MPRIRHRLEHLIEDVNDAIYTVDLATRAFTSINLAGSALTGYSQNELLGAPITTIIAAESLPLVQKKIQQKIKSRKPTVYEIEILKKNGKRVPVEISSRILYEGEKPVEILGIARDITERKLAERQKEIFFSVITHEIKNPLTAIAMYASLLSKGAKLRKDEKELKLITQLAGQVEAINQLLSDFIEVNQLQLGKFSVVKAPFAVDELVSGIVRSYRKNTTGHTITVEGRISGQLVADRQRVSQVLHNLLSNAMKYSPTGKSIVISLSESAAAVTIAVRDFGIGIPEREHKAIFDLFYRVTQESGEVKGHGLGLFICREIVRSHRGRIWVESEPGKGSTFSFSLPRLL